MKKVIIGCLLSAISTGAFAYGVFNGTVKDVRVDRGGWGIIAFNGAVTGDFAACRNEYYTSHMSFDVKTEGGKAIYSMALAAVASGKLVSAVGTGSCSDYADTVESLGYMHFTK